MRGFNKVILMGNLTRDPQLKYLPSQTAVVEFGLAMNRKWRTPDGQDRDEVCFVECAAFGKTAETLNQWCTKGKPLFIEGRLKYDQWEDKQGGGKRSKLSVVIENFQFLGDGGGGGAQAAADGSEADASAGGAPAAPRQPYRAPANRPAPRPIAAPPQQQQEPAPDQPFSDEAQFKDDDIPF